MIFYDIQYTGAKKPPEMTFSGEWSGIIDEGGNNWHAEFKTSGDLDIQKLGNARSIDIYAVGGGGPGGEAFPSSSTYTGGSGGGGSGGDCVTSIGVKLTKGRYEITIGDSGNDTKMERNGSAIVTAKGGEKGGPASEFGDGRIGTDGAGTRNAFGVGAEKYGFHSNERDGNPGAKNTGNGGDGARTGEGWENVGQPGPGGTGILIVRNRRDAT